MNGNRIGKLSEEDLNEIAETAYRQITGGVRTETPNFKLPKDTTNDECIKEGLSGLTDCFEAALGGEENKAALRRMWDQQMGVLNILLKHRDGS